MHLFKLFLFTAKSIFALFVTMNNTTTPTAAQLKKVNLSKEAHKAMQLLFDYCEEKYVRKMIRRVSEELKVSQDQIRTLFIIEDND